MAQAPSAAHRSIGDVAAKLADLTDTVLFGDVWERRGLSPRDRSLVTVTALVALYRNDQLTFHLRLALQNGLSEDELVEAVTHLAFYAGWPNAMGAIGVLKTVLAERDRVCHDQDHPRNRRRSRPRRRHRPPSPRRRPQCRRHRPHP